MSIRWSVGPSVTRLSNIAENSFILTFIGRIFVRIELVFKISDPKQNDTPYDKIGQPVWDLEVLSSILFPHLPLLPLLLLRHCLSFRLPLPLLPLLIFLLAF